MENEKKELIVEMKEILSRIAKHDETTVTEREIENYLKISQLLKNVELSKEVERFKEICKLADEYSKGIY